MVEITRRVNGQDQKPNALFLACKLPRSFGVVYMGEFDRVKLSAEGLLDEVPPVMDLVPDGKVVLAFNLINHLCGLFSPLLFTSILDVVEG